jgi:hypothetical protein
MNQKSWLACANPQTMLTFLRGRPSERKFRLFMLACWRRIWHLLEPETREALEVADRFVEGDSCREELEAAFDWACSRQEGEETSVSYTTKALPLCVSPAFRSSNAALAAEAVVNDLAAEALHQRPTGLLKTNSRAWSSGSTTSQFFPGYVFHRPR